MVRPGTSITNTILTIEVGHRTAWLHGDRVPALLRRAGAARKSWDAAYQCWAIPVNRLWNVIAAAEKVQRREVHLEQVNR
jgi:hypothetical protein